MVPEEAEVSAEAEAPARFCSPDASAEAEGRRWLQAENIVTSMRNDSNSARIRFMANSLPGEDAGQVASVPVPEPMPTGDTRLCEPASAAADPVVA